MFVKFPGNIDLVGDYSRLWAGRRHCDWQSLFICSQKQGLWPEQGEEHIHNQLGSYEQGNHTKLCLLQIHLIIALFQKHIPDVLMKVHKPGLSK